MSTQPEQPPSVLEHISTRWPLLHDPAQFVLRYAPAIRRYLGAILRDPDSVHDVSQAFLVRILEQRFVPPSNLRGRFRDYLKTSVRNAALAHGRQDRRQPIELVHEVADDSEPDEADRVWAEEWRQCLLERAWDALDAHERSSPGSLAYTVLRLRVDHPDASSNDLAHLVSQRIGKPMRADATRQQLSRARQLFARLLFQETGRTLSSPSREAILEELAALQLASFVQHILPEDEGQ